jgi:branched-chain amino acid transport system ATP-binding protein
MAEDTTNLLALDNITVAYGPVVALSDVSVNVRAGEVVCLLGSNSAGKSTLIRAAMGLVEPQAGRILSQGRELLPGDLRGRVDCGIAWVPEGRGVFAAMSVIDNLLMGGYAVADQKSLRGDVEQMLELFPHLARRRNQVAGTLSGGEQQMLALGRALMSRPSLVLMDEPSMGLAPVMMEQVFDVIAAIHKRGVAVLLVEQNAHMALTIAQRFYVLQKGRIALQGDVQDGRLTAGDGGQSRTVEEDELESAYLGG